MNDPSIIQIMSAVVFVLVLSLLVAPRRQPVKGSKQKVGVRQGWKRGIEPGYCFNDCMRIQGQSKDIFCGVACGTKEAK